MSAVFDALLAEMGPGDAQRLASVLAPHLPRILDPRDRRTDQWMTTQEAAEYLRLSVHAMHRLTSARQIPFHQDGPGCRCWFRRSELDAWRSR
jgi:excisionase family DNA binding protein